MWNGALFSVHPYCTNNSARDAWFWCRGVLFCGSRRLPVSVFAELASHIIWRQSTQKIWVCLNEIKGAWLIIPIQICVYFYGIWPNLTLLVWPWPQPVRHSNWLATDATDPTVTLRSLDLKCSKSQWQFAEKLGAVGADAERISWIL
jgi:hypothetical protein